MRFEIEVAEKEKEEKEETTRIRIRKVGSDVNLEAYVDEDWALLAWVTEEREVFTVDDGMMPEGFTEG